MKGAFRLDQLTPHVPGVPYRRGARGPRGPYRPTERERVSTELPPAEWFDDNGFVLPQWREAVAAQRLRLARARGGQFGL